MAFKDVTQKGEWWAWQSWEAYRSGGRGYGGEDRDTRAIMWRKARNYRRRAIRVSQWLNKRY